MNKVLKSHLQDRHWLGDLLDEEVDTIERIAVQHWLSRVDAGPSLDHTEGTMNDKRKPDVQHRIETVLKLILEAVRKLSTGCATGRRTGGFGFIVGQPKTKHKNMPLELKITNEQQIAVTLTPKTDTGKPAKLDGAPTWSTVSGNSAVNVSADGLSATLVSSDDPGDTEVLVKADADLGEGIEEISDVIKLSVVGATAKNLGLTAGAPEAKPTV